MDLRITEHLKIKKISYDDVYVINMSKITHFISLIKLSLIPL